MGAERTKVVKWPCMKELETARLEVVGAQVVQRPEKLVRLLL